MKNNELFGSILEKLIVTSGKSTNQIERELGYPRNALHGYKLGGEPSGKRLIELAHYFGTSPEYLLGIPKFPNKESINSIFHQLNCQQKVEMHKLCKKWFLSEIIEKLVERFE